MRPATSRSERLACAMAVIVALGSGLSYAQPPAAATASGQRPGRSDPAFSQPSLAPGVDYTVPSEAEVKAALDRIRDHFVRSTPYRIIDTSTGQPITDLSTPVKTAGIDNRNGEFNDWSYLNIPFLSQMGKATGETKYFDDAARQVIGMSARLFNSENGLFDHSWFADMDDDARFYWGRGDGWAMMAMAELLSVMPDSHPDRAKILAIFRRGARGAVETQGRTGLWHQLLDRTDSYLESSASAMFTFAIARGVSRGWLPTSYAPVAQSGWRALEGRIRPDGQIEGICVGTTAAYDAVYYYNRPTELKAMQGYGPTLMAGAEVITMLRSFDIRRANNTFYYDRKKQ